MEAAKIENSFNFLEEVKKKVIENTAKIVNENFSTADEVAKIEKEERKKLPTNFNLLDLVGRNIYETKHSKILGELLRYKHKEKFLFLNSFIEFLESHFNFEEKLKLESPTIEIEKSNIDILIKNKDFALIIENKINYAKDQDEQIKNYVEKLEKDGYSREKNIYVAYLTRRGAKEVEEYSLPKELKDKLGNRFLEINYYSHILPFLENILLDIPLKEETLISGIRQYIDYLKGILGIRKGEEKMHEEIKKVLEEKLKLKDISTDKEKLEVIQKKKSEFESCVQGLQNLEHEITERRNSLRRIFCEKLYKKLQNSNTGEWIKTEENYSSHYRILNKKYIKDFGNNVQFFFMFALMDWINPNLFCCVSVNYDIHPWEPSWKKGVLEDFKEPLRIIQEYFKERIEITDTHWWHSPNLCGSKFSLEGYDLVNSFFTIEQNKIFEQKTDEIVELFFNNIMEMFEIWKQFNEDDEQR